VAEDAALVTRQPPPRLLHHADRGSQYAGHDHQARLQVAQAQVSKRRLLRQCFDGELLGHAQNRTCREQPFASHAAARCDILLYIEGFYNLRRRHSALGYLSPVEFERRHFGVLSAPKAVGA
jgi:putative transposase